MKIKKNDKVKVIAGKDKGKEGKVLVVDRAKNKVIVEGVNMVKKHVKPGAQNPQGGIITKEAFIDASNVMFVYQGKPTRIGYTVSADGTKQRVAKSTGEVID
ncbi:MAG: 50S ribosomal protein L24 [Lachnospirales bacterium]